MFVVGEGCEGFCLLRVEVEWSCVVKKVEVFIREGSRVKVVEVFVRKGSRVKEVEVLVVKG